MKPELIVQIPPLQPDGQHYLQAEARQGELTATIILRPYWPESRTYVLEHYWDRTNRAIRRKLTPGQDERGRVLVGQLRERLKEALVAAGWQDAGTNYEGRLLWRYVGPATSEPPSTQPAAGTRAAKEAKSASATRPPQRKEDVPPRAPTPPKRPIEAPVPLRTPLEPDQAPLAQKRIEVPVATKPRAAYQRTISTRPVMFTCQQCGKQVSQQRFPGPKPRYCDEACRELAKRAGTLVRVQRFRARQRENSESHP